MDPEELAAAYVRKAGDFLAAGRPGESIGLYDRAIEVDPECVEAWTGKAIALKAMDRFGEALECVERAIDIRPSPIAEVLREILIGVLRGGGSIS